MMSPYKETPEHKTKTLFILRSLGVKFAKKGS